MLQHFLLCFHSKMTYLCNTIKKQSIKRLKQHADYVYILFALFV